MDTLVISFEKNEQHCLRCGTVEKFATTSMIAEMRSMDAFREKHAACTQPVTNDEKPFEKGECVEFCGEEAVVEANYGTSGVVLIPGEGRCTWYWNFQGTETHRVRRAL